MENNINKEFQFGHHSRSGKVMGGIIIVLIGSVLLAKQLGVLFPAWLFTWKTLIISIGLYIGAKRNFRFGGWIIPIMIGAVFMLGDFYPELSIKQYFWPVLIIAIGIVMILSPGKRFWRNRYEKKNVESDGIIADAEIDTNGKLEIVSIFGGVKRSMLNEEFKGGEIVNIMGGTELNLSAAILNKRVELEIVQVFGGTKLIVPSHWIVQQADAVSIMGGIDDKRYIKDTNAVPENAPVLVLKGVNIMGGIDIKSF